MRRRHGDEQVTVRRLSAALHVQPMTSGRHPQDGFGRQAGGRSTHWYAGGMPTGPPVITEQYWRLASHVRLGPQANVRWTATVGGSAIVTARGPAVPHASATPASTRPPRTRGLKDVTRSFQVER